MTGLEKLLRWHSMRGDISTQDATAIGNPATFETTLVRPLVQCKAKFMCTQEGSGVPSPDNIRPIVGLAGITVYRSGENTLNADAYPAIWQTEAGTVYGGYVDLVSGTLVVAYGYVVYDGSSDEDWKMESISIGKNFYISIPDSTGAYSPDVVCSIAKSRQDGEAYAQGMCFISSSKNFNLAVQSIATDVSELCAWLSVHPAQLVYKLANALTFQLSPQVIRTVAGENNIWNSANGNMTVTYKKKG